MTLEFLDREDVLDIHALQMARYDGADGLRDPGLLESALAQPQATFAGDFPVPMKRRLTTENTENTEKSL